MRDLRCIPNRILMHYSMTFCSINSASMCLHTENSKNKKCILNTRMMHFNNWKNEVWNVKHFMHSTVAALITSRSGRGYQTPIINDKITLHNSYTTWLRA